MGLLSHVYGAQELCYNIPVVQNLNNTGSDTSKMQRVGRYFVNMELYIIYNRINNVSCSKQENGICDRTLEDLYL